MGEPDRLFFSKASGAILVALAVTTSCSTVDKVKPPLPPGGTSPSGVELVDDEPMEPVVEDVEDYEYEDFEQEEEPFVDEMDSTILESEPDRPDDETLVVIDTGAKDLTVSPLTLAEAAQAERERRDLALPTDLVITDETLADFATGGNLTVAETSNDQAGDGASGPSEYEIELAAKEEYWRQGARELRQAWRDAHDSIEELEGKVFDLRQRFYREDDGFYRDAEIKPAWDRAIDQLEEARLETESKQRELEEFLEAGREAAALPGWLREGIELEPKPTAAEESTAEPAEPVIYEPEASDPP